MLHSLVCQPMTKWYSLMYDPLNDEFKKKQKCKTIPSWLLYKFAWSTHVLGIGPGPMGRLFGFDFSWIVENLTKNEISEI